MATGRRLLLPLPISLLLVCMLPTSQARKLLNDGESSGTGGVAGSVVVDDGSSVSNGSQSYMCLACLELSREALHILSSPETQHIATTFLNDHLCNRFKPDTERKCEEMVDAYVPLILVRLQDRFAPEKLCEGQRYCQTSSDALFDLKDLLLSSVALSEFRDF